MALCTDRNNVKMMLRGVAFMVLILPGAAFGHDAGGQRIKNVAEPTANSDAATKYYVDNTSAAAGHAVLGAAHGDTTTNAVTRGSLIYGNSTPAWDELVLGASGTILRSDGTDASWAATTLITTLGTIATGTWQATDVGVQYGGTGVSSLTDGGILLGSGTGAITALGVATNGQIPIGDGTTDPVLATLTGVANETDITNAAGSITIGIVDPLAVAKGGTGTTSLNDLITLTTHTTGNYAAGDSEAGNALTGDSATSFFSSGTIEHERGGLEADISAIVDGDFIVGTGAGTLGLESGATVRISLGLAIGTNVQAWDTQLDSLSAFTAAEVSQLANIDSSTISTAQWGYLGAMDQSVATGDSVTFANITSSGIIKAADGSAAAPSITFTDDLDTGFYRVSADRIGVSSFGTLIATFRDNSLYLGAGSTGALVKGNLASATVPSLLPRGNDPDTGVGRAGTDQLSLIAGGVETARITNTSLTAIGLSIAADTDIGATIGRTVIGNADYSDYAWFSHIDKQSVGNYALMQSTLGATYLNCSTNYKIYFLINGQTRAYMDISEFNITGPLNVTGDINATGDVQGGTLTADDGFTGTFDSGEAETVTVVNGIITSVL